MGELIVISCKFYPMPLLKLICGAMYWLLCPCKSNVMELTCGWDLEHAICHVKIEEKYIPILWTPQEDKIQQCLMCEIYKSNNHTWVSIRDNSATIALH